jgi:hypothetical protein
MQDQECVERQCVASLRNFERYSLRLGNSVLDKWYCTPLLWVRRNALFFN